jgi:carboxymethylenebutenolidase
MTIEQQDVRFPADGGHPMAASLAVPSDGVDRRRPAVIVIHEIFGLNDDIRRITARFAAAGYVALAPDLFDGPGPRALCVARTMWSTRTGEGRAFRDLEAARLWLAARPDVDAERTGVAGFCLGGGFALLYARRAPVGVAAPFYGDVPKTAEVLRGICPVVGGYGGRDRVFGPQGERLRKLLDELEVPSDVVVYPDAGHSFMSQHEPGIMKTLGAIGPMKVGYDEHAAEDSWRRMLAFFGEHLGTP